MKTCTQCTNNFSDSWDGVICPGCCGKNLATEHLKDIALAVSTLFPKHTEPESLHDALEDMISLIDEHGDKTLIKAHCTRILRARNALSQNSKFKEVLIDFRDHGVRHDCNPTLCLDGDQNKLIAFFYTYIKGIDDYVRNTARSAFIDEILNDGGLDDLN